jgi:lipid-binding SYLF domain-containing protein
MGIRVLSMILISIFINHYFEPAVANDSPQAPDATQQVLVDRSAITLSDFLNDASMTYLKNNLKYAKGILIIPSFFKAAFWIGGSGGRGILMVRDPKTNKWSGPLFYTLGGGSIGLQFGVSSSEVIMIVMTQPGLEALYATNFKLGGNVSVAAGPVGIGAEGATAPNLSADFVSFARSKGAFIGIALDGAVIAVSNDDNQAYYGERIRPVDVISQKVVNNPKSSSIRNQLFKASKK